MNENTTAESMRLGQLSGKGEVTQCGACQHETRTANRFCSNCGHSLWEDCPQCESAALIGQRYCDSCGCNLAQHVQSRLVSLQDTLARAARWSDSGNFKQAIRALEEISKLEDFRCTDVVQAARSQLSECREVYSEWLERLPTIEAKAKRHADQLQFTRAVSLLQSVPAGMISKELEALLQECAMKAATINGAKVALKQSLDKKDYATAVTELQTLMDLCPQEPKYLELAKQIAQRLVTNTARLREQGRYAEALLLLGHCPGLDQSAEHCSLRDELEEIVFLRRLVAQTPFAYPLLANIIERLLVLTPEDDKLQRLLQKHTGLRAQKPEQRPWLLPSWMKSGTGLLPQPIAPCTYPPAISGTRPECLLRHGAQFWIAFGLALQGIGRGQREANFLQPDKPKSRLGLLGKRKSPPTQRAWGIDIGSSSIKALELSVVDEKIQIENAILLPLRVRDGDGRELRKADPSELMRALAKLAGQLSFREGNVVSNMPAGELFARYPILPADKEKMHATFLEQEARAHIPINPDLLAHGSYRFPVADGQLTQRSILLAVKRSESESRQSMFHQCKLNLTALLGEPFALLNTWNYLSQLQPPADTEAATVLLDVGQRRTLVLVAKRAGGWYRCLDWGLNDLTAAIVSDQKLGYADAEILRRNPANAPLIQKALSSMSNACLVPRRELERSLHAARESLGELSIGTSWLVGGGAYQPFLGSWLNGEPDMNNPD